MSGIDDTKVFNESFEKYQDAVEAYSYGLITTDKSDFIKIAAFFKALIEPTINDYVKELHKIIKK